MTPAGWVVLAAALATAVMLLAAYVMQHCEVRDLRLAADERDGELGDAYADLETERVERARAEGALEWLSRRRA